MMDNYKERLEVTNDDEWKVLEDKIQKVLDARQAVGSFGGFGGPGGRGGGRRANNNNNTDTNAAPADANGGGRGGRRGGNRGTPAPETEALQSAVEAKASADDLKAKMAKVRDARKAAEAKLESAQEDLRKLLTVRQEASAMLMGLLR